MGHTPGPWKWQQNCIIAVPPDGDVIVLHTTRPGTGINIRQPDARLIAAAPELLAACKTAAIVLEQAEAALDLFERSHNINTAMKRLKDAIDKAEGK